MAVISISEAARTWRITCSTLQRALQEGRLSATVRADGSKGIDTTELIRVFGEAPVALQARGRLAKSLIYFIGLDQDMGLSFE